MISGRRRNMSVGGVPNPNSVVLDISPSALRRNHSALPALQTDVTPLTPKQHIIHPTYPSYPHTSSCRSLHIELRIASPSVKLIRNEELQTSKSIPVFSDNDRVGGEVVLEPSCYPSGRLSVTIEGIFQYTSSGTEAVGDPTYNGKDRKDRHTFYTSTTVFPVSPPAESPRTPAALRETLSTHMRRWPSVSSVNSVRGPGRAARSFPFQFELPHSQYPGQELPKTFSASALVGSGTRGRAFVESTSISYKVTALWEPSDSYDNRAQLEMPLLVLSNSNHPKESSTAQPEFWLEMPLISSISVPFQCAVTLPSPANFSRSSAVPYYVVFTTAPKSSTLARDIAVNATISVTLVRYVSVNIAPHLPPSPPVTPSSSAEDSDSSSSYRMPSRRKFFGRTRSNTGPSLSSRILEESASPRSFHNNALIFARTPSNPPFTETRNLKNQLSEGFPKRPRRRKDQVQSTMDRPKTGLPDGLFKGELKLDTDMLPGIDWAGISVKYYLDVAVIYQEHETRSRISVGIF